MTIDLIVEDLHDIICIFNKEHWAQHGAF